MKHEVKRVIVETTERQDIITPTDGMGGVGVVVCRLEEEEQDDGTAVSASSYLKCSSYQLAAAAKMLLGELKQHAEPLFRHVMLELMMTDLGEMADKMRSEQESPKMPNIAGLSDIDEVI